MENKKRKIRAFLELCNDKCANGASIDKQRPALDSETDIAELRAFQTRTLKLMRQRPRFRLLLDGFKARIDSCEKQLSVSDIRCLILSTLIPSSRLSFIPSFYELLHCESASKVAIFVLNNVDFGFDSNESQLFTETIAFEASENWLDALIHVPLSKSQSRKIVDPFLQDVSVETSVNYSPVTKTDLLLSLKQMYSENYPLPFEDNSMKSTKKEYYSVHDSSPLFALDCEMCITIDDESVVTRIALVNEQLETVIDTFVKPDKPIKDYLTQFSGVTKEILDPITVSIEDVRNMLNDFLPQDAIICGHSLNFDLKALGLCHPYVIDTSIIYNESGYRAAKTSLKNLVAMHLNERIQCGSNGHCCVEDAKACMKLVKLKLIRGLEYGDRVLNSKQQFSLKRLPIARYIELKDINVKMFYDYLHLDNENKFICVMNSNDDNLKRVVSSALVVANCICILISKGVCRIRV